MFLETTRKKPDEINALIERLNRGELSAAQFLEQVKDQPLKYRNKPVTDPDGERFDSRWEYDYWRQLQLEQAAGQIRNLRHHVSYPLTIEIAVRVHVGDFEADYVYERRHGLLWVEEVVDAKGKQTDLSRYQHKLMLAIYGIKVIVVYKRRRRGRT